jgi:hypothetical protein
MDKFAQLQREYLNKFPAKDVDRFTIACPDCKQGFSLGGRQRKMFSL